MDRNVELLLIEQREGQMGSPVAELWRFPLRSGTLLHATERGRILSHCILDGTAEGVIEAIDMHFDFSRT